MKTADEIEATFANIRRLIGYTDNYETTIANMDVEVIIKELARLRKIEAAAKAVITRLKVTHTWPDSKCVSVDIGYCDYDRLKEALEEK